MNTPSEITFRRAQREDCAEIMRALTLLAQSIGVAERLQSTQQDLEEGGFGPNPCFRVTLAEIDGRPAAMCLHFPTFSTWLGKPGLYVQDLFVYEPYRSARVGAQLLRHVAQEGRRDGYTHIKLTVDEGNEGAARFYQRHGFAAGTDEYIYKLTGAAFDHFCDAAN